MNSYNPAPSSRILLVEGTDDSHVISQIRDRNQPMPEFSISDKYGISSLLDSIPQEIREPDRQTLGIVVDRDVNLSSRWDAVRNRLRDAGYYPPAQPDPDGTIIPETDDLPRVGIWLMPDNQSTGELEDFVSEMIPDDDPVWPLSQDYIDGIPTPDRRFTESKTQRAKVHAWLAAREDPRQMGQAIRARDLEIDGELCEKFVDWLRKLFE